MTKIYTTYDKILDNIYEFLRQHMTYLTQHMQKKITTYVNNLYNTWQNHTTYKQLLHNIWLILQNMWLHVDYILLKIRQHITYNTHHTGVE